MPPDRQQMEVNNLIQNKKEEAKDNEHCSTEAKNITRQMCTQAVKDNRTIIKDGDTIRTRSGCISKKQTDWNTGSHQYRPSRPVSCTNKCHTASGNISQF